MKKWIVLIVFTLLACAGCGRREVMVESGTYEGSVLKVNPDEKEIYVSLDKKRVLELYFSEKTTVSRGEEKTSFDTLEKGHSVRVEVEKTDEGMVPLRVIILD
ncbi:MAG: hypothetical protein ACLFQK_00775 [Fibrobacterota bacterium]